MEASLRMGINTCNGINDMPDTDDVSALSDTISKRRQQVEIRPQGAQTLACHFLPLLILMTVGIAKG